MGSDANRAAQLSVERVRLMYRNYPFTLSANLVMGLLLTAALWRLAPQRLLAGWLLIDLLLTLKGAADCWRFRPMLFGADPASAVVALALRHLFFIAAVTGGLWGGAMLIILAAPDPVVQQIIFTAIIGMAFGGAVFLSVDKRTFYTYILAMLLPAALVFSLLDAPYHLVFSGFSIALLFAAAAFAHNVRALIEKSLALRFENLDLVAALTEQKEQADYANLSKSRFLAAASHDLRQPMHALGLFVNALGSRLSDPASLKIMGHIVTAVETLQGMFNALLDVSKLDAGVLTCSRQDFPVQLLFDRLGDEFRMEAEARGLYLRIVPSRLILYGDAALLERCLRNFLSNALCYTQRGGVVLGCRRRGGGVRLEVWDSGIGIAPALHGEIFQEFYQVGNPERDRNKGFGLGLAIVQRISRLTQHPVSLRSLPGKGSVFRIEVPRGAASAVAAAPVQEVVLNPLQGLLIGLVDDDKEVIAAMRALLASWGCELLAGEAGADLLAAMRETGRVPDVVISDYRLRDGENGAEVIRQVAQQAGRTLPGIIVTGDTGEARLREAAASGYHLLHKPVRPAKLRALLSHLLNARET